MPYKLSTGFKCQRGTRSASASTTSQGYLTIWRKICQTQSSWADQLSDDAVNLADSELRKMGKGIISQLYATSLAYNKHTRLILNKRMIIRWRNECAVKNTNLDDEGGNGQQKRCKLTFRKDCWEKSVLVRRVLNGCEYWLVIVKALWQVAARISIAFGHHPDGWILWTGPRQTEVPQHVLCRKPSVGDFWWRILVSKVS
jgi:hypothetical protein